MATFLTSPISPSSPPRIFFQDCMSKKHAPHLSGATMLGYFKNSEEYLATPTTSPIDIPRLHTNSKRSSYVSTTKSRSRLSNSDVMETLQKIEMELTAHRSIMLDIQSRISQLESSSSKSAGVLNNSLRTLNQSNSPVKRTSSVGRESPEWWELYLNYERNSNTGINAKRLLKTPRRLSGFEFDFDALRTKLHMDVSTVTPEVDDIPALTPTSDRDGQSDTDHEDQAQSVYNMRFPTQNLAITNGNHASDIVEHIVDFDIDKVPTPPLIQSPPRSVRSKTASIVNEEDDDITALPTLPSPPTPNTEAGRRCSKGIKGLFNYRVFLKGKAQKKDPHLWTRVYRKVHFAK